MKCFANLALLLLFFLSGACSDTQCPEEQHEVDGQCLAVTGTPTPKLEVQPSVKTLTFHWEAIEGIESYQLLFDSEGSEAYTPLGEDLSPETTDFAHRIAVYDYPWQSARYKLQACNALGCAESRTISTAEYMLDTIGVLNSTNAEPGDYFGFAVASSADGTTVAISARYEGSSATGIDGDGSNNDSPGSGAVYLFTVDDHGEWSQQAYIKASNGKDYDTFGTDLALSADGSTLAVGAPSEGSAEPGMNGKDNPMESGAVYVFTKSSDGSWSEQAYLKASNAEMLDNFGMAVALSADGNTLAVGATGEDSSATGIDGDQEDNAENDSGAAYLFTRSDDTWAQQVYIKASNTDKQDNFGSAIALSSEGNILVVGAPNESGAGAAYVFEMSGGSSWTEQAYLKASNTEIESDDNFASAVSLSADGSLLAVGAPQEDSSAQGIDGDQTSNHMESAGAVYLYKRQSAAGFSQIAYVKASNTDPRDYFGHSVALSSDGSMLAVGANSEASNATGVGGDQSNDDLNNAGAVYVFRATEDSWEQSAYIKSKNNTLAEYFGSSLCFDDSGHSLFIGATAALGDTASSGGSLYIY
ncbi:MAG: hypothetical protein IPJ88_10745 [Myxococcales bacterium]|nr:MAG: hypothetical protein IPJ88_10745 [Myxococcales bacterium]